MPIERQKTDLFPLSINNPGGRRIYFNPEDSQTIWQRESSPKTNVGNLPSSLLDVGLALNAIEANGYVPENVRCYIKADTRTQAFEATAPGVVMTTYQAWDSQKKELVGYGFSTVDIYQKGLEKARDMKDKKFGQKMDFEIARREIELEDARALNTAIERGELDSQIKIVISPYPVGADEKTAQEIGYFSNKKIAMARVLEFDNLTNQLKVSQIMVEGTDLAAFTHMASLLQGQSIEGTLTPDELLGMQFYLPKGKLRGGVVDIARIYDRVLEARSGNRHFLGEQIGGEEKDYVGILSKTKQAEALTAPIIENLTRTHIEAAQSLIDGQATHFIQSAIEVSLKNLSGADGLLASERRTALESALKGRFDTDAASALIDTITRDNYLTLLCLTDANRAVEVFDSKDVEMIRQKFIANPTATNIPPLTPKEAFTLFFCGSSMEFGNKRTARLFGSTMAEFKAFAREGVRTLCCTCPFCNKQVEAKIFNGQIHCEEPPKGCGKTAPWKD